MGAVLPLAAPLAASLVASCGWLAPVPGPLAAAFDPPAGPRGAGHRGVDLRADPGEPVRAPVAGTVAVAGWIGGRPVLAIDAGGIRATLEPVSAAPGIGPGVPVRRGDVVGTVGPGGTSHCAGGCVHLGARLPGRPPRYLDPATLGCRPVLKPSLP